MRCPVCDQNARGRALLCQACINAQLFDEKKAELRQQREQLQAALDDALAKRVRSGRAAVAPFVLRHILCRAWRSALAAHGRPPAALVALACARRRAPRPACPRSRSRPPGDVAAAAARALALAAARSARTRQTGGGRG